MPRIRITDETMRALRREGTYKIHLTGVRQTDGTWLVKFDDEVTACFERIALPGESVYDTTQRVVRQPCGGRPN